MPSCVTLNKVITRKFTFRGVPQINMIVIECVLRRSIEPSFFHKRLALANVKIHPQCSALNGNTSVTYRMNILLCIRDEEIEEKIPWLKDKVFRLYWMTGTARSCCHNYFCYSSRNLLVDIMSISCRWKLDSNKTRLHVPKTKITWRYSSSHRNRAEGKCWANGEHAEIIFFFYHT